MQGLCASERGGGARAGETSGEDGVSWRGIEERLSGCNERQFRVTSRAMTRTMRRAVVAILLMVIAAATAGVAVAQQTQNQYEPANTPGAGQKLLAQFAGEWDVVKTFFPANGAPRVTKETCKQYMIQDGKFLQSDFTFLNADGTKSTGTGISGFDSKANRFTTGVVRLAADDDVDPAERWDV